MNPTDDKFSVFNGMSKLAEGLREADAKKFAEAELVKQIPAAMGKVTDWTPRGHLFYEDGEALVPSTICIRPDREGAPTHVVPARIYPLLSYSGVGSAQTRFLLTSPVLAPRMLSTDELVSYMRRIFWLTDEPGSEDDAIWVLLPGHVTPFQTFITETVVDGKGDLKPRMAKSKLVAHIPLDESEVQDGMEIMLKYRNGGRKQMILHAIKHSAIMVTIDGMRQTLHWTAIREIYKRQVIGELEWEVGEE